MWKCGNMSSLSLSNNSGTVEMWKWRNMSSLSSSSNSGSVEMWKYVFNVKHFSLEKQTLMKKIVTETHFIGPRFIILSMVKCKLP